MVTGLFKIKQGDLLPVLEAQLVTLDADGEVEGPQDLTGATVVFTMRNKKTNEIKINEQAATVTDILTGMVEYEWSGDDTDTPGSYYGEFEAMFSSKPLSFPNGKKGFDIKITPDSAL